MSIVNEKAFPNALTRTIAQPLDTSDVWETKVAADEYIASGLAYKGQIVTILKENKYTVYVVQPASGGGLSLVELETGSATLSQTVSTLSETVTSHTATLDNHTSAIATISEEIQNIKTSIGENLIALNNLIGPGQ